MELTLIETLGWFPGRGFVRGERHLRRLARSAAAFGWAFDESKTVSALDRSVVGGGGPLRTRLQYGREGIERIDVSPFKPVSDDVVWTVAIAETRLNSADTLIRHKTGRRPAHDAARREFGAGRADEVVLLNQRGEVCEGAITSIFLRIGAERVLLTPDIGCGLLPGVLREEVLDTGRAREATVSVEDLKAAAEFYVGNSLRGFIPARLTGLAGKGGG